MKHKLFLLVALLLILTVTSCHQESDALYSYGQNDNLRFREADTCYVGEFKLFWNAMNQNYPLWDYEREFGFDWDAAYDEFLPRFEALDERRENGEEITDEEYRSLIEDLVRPFHEGHMAVQFKNHSTGNYVAAIPSNLRNADREDLNVSSGFTPNLSYYKNDGRLSHYQSASTKVGTVVRWFLDRSDTTYGWGYVQDRIETLSAKEAAGTIEADEVIELNALKDVDAACEAYNSNYTDDEKYIWMSQVYQYYTNAVAGTSAQPVPGLFDMDPHYKDAGLNIRSAVLDDGVAYLYFSQFALSPYFVKEFGYFDSASQTVLAQNQAIVDVWNNWFDQIQEMKKSGTLKGVIIDVRSNGGGFLYDFQFVLGALLPQDSSFQIGYFREKSGVGRYDYGPLLPDERPALSAPHETITEPIVVLTNCRSVSMSEMTAMGAKALSNARVVGKRSWGATASLINDPTFYSQIYAGGIGEMNITPVYVYLTKCASFLMDNKCYEGVGIEPDIEVDLDVDLFYTTGSDTQLERALQYIENGN